MLNVLTAALFRHTAGRQRLQNMTDFNGILQFRFILNQPFHNPFAAIRNMFSHKSPTARFNFHIAPGLQQAESFPDSASPHAHLLAKILLCRKLLSWLIGFLLNKLENTFFDLLNDRDALNWFHRLFLLKCVFCCIF